MVKEKTSLSKNTSKKIRPALTPEGRESQLVSMAVDLAQKQLLDGTASSQVITHFLKLGTVKEKLEIEKIKKENELLEAKAENLKTLKNSETLYENAINAMKEYSGFGE